MIKVQCGFGKENWSSVCKRGEGGGGRSARRSGQVPLLAELGGVLGAQVVLINTHFSGVFRSAVWFGAFWPGFALGRPEPKRFSAPLRRWTPSRSSLPATALAGKSSASRTTASACRTRSRQFSLGSLKPPFSGRGRPVAAAWRLARRVRRRWPGGRPFRTASGPRRRGPVRHNSG